MSYDDHPSPSYALACEWKVTMAKGRARKITAEYYRIVDGTLIFRNAQPGSYPITVAVIAAGAWVALDNAGLK